MITYERQEDGTLKQVDSPPKRAELMFCGDSEQRIMWTASGRHALLGGDQMTNTEREALCARIDELCVENEKLRDENTKLREFAGHVANALGINREWCVTSWCDTDCMIEFGCQSACCGGETRCPAWARLRELGVVK